MQLEVGSIVEGKITGTTKFGAFVEFGDKVTGLIHISEIADEYVENVSDFLKTGDSVKVKVLKIDGQKINLSAKQVCTLKPKNKKVEQQKIEKDKFEHINPNNRAVSQKPEVNLSFEEMLNKFKKSSEEKMSDIKKNQDGKRNGYSRRRIR